MNSASLPVKSARLLALVAVCVFAAACNQADPTPTNTVGATATATTPSGGQTAIDPTPTISPDTSTATAVPTAIATLTAIAGTPTPTVEAGEPLQLQVIPLAPERDLYELGRRLRLKQSADVPRFADPPPAPLSVGDEFPWKVNRDSGNVTVTARVIAVSDNAYWLFDTAFLPSQDDIDDAVEEFENNTWPSVTEVFGTPWTPGVDGDPRIVVFHSRLRTGVGGYYSSADEYPTIIVPDSNERETIYMSANLKPGSTGYNGVLAHELQHAIHWAYDPSEESWVGEGLSEYASQVAGYPPGSVLAFTRNPGVSLTEWASEISTAGANYGGAALFMEYLAWHYGGNAMISALVQETLDSYESVDNTLAAMGRTETFEDLFEDWVIANYLDEDSGPYSYPGRTMQSLAEASVSLSNDISASVRPFGADYFDVANALGDVTLTFDGEASAPLFEVEPYSGDTCWWTNAGDSINTRLVREVDLGEVESATLMFWAWYDIEQDWDYAYVTVSTDGGITWSTARSSRSTATNPNGNSYGHGITGSSNDWVQIEADLSLFAGQEILLAFEYVTDDAVHERGACFDDFSIPEIGWFDNTSDDGGWESFGFARVNNLQPQEYLVQVIRQRIGLPAEVIRVPVDETGHGKWELLGVTQTEKVTVVVSAIQRNVTGRADYTFRLDRQP